MVSSAAGSTSVTADRVILTVPFQVLRTLDIARAARRGGLGVAAVAFHGETDPDAEQIVGTSAGAVIGALAAAGVEVERFIANSRNNNSAIDCVGLTGCNNRIAIYFINTKDNFFNFSITSYFEWG